MEEVDALYEGLETPLDPEGNFGALVALRDYRDGTNLTGLNPKQEKLLRHIGFSGHINSPVMMQMIQRDRWDILDAMLVAINANDKRYPSHQFNVIPVARARNLGIIGMKVFADGAMYSKYADWTRDHEGVVRTVGTPELPSKPLIEYALTTPGIHTAIIGIGQISDDPLKCQLVQNYYAAQVEPESLSADKRREIEKGAGLAKEGKTNYYQLPFRGLTPPENIRTGGWQQVELSWDSALAATAPLLHYEVYREDQRIGVVPHQPQVTREPFRFQDTVRGQWYSLVAVDQYGNRAESDRIEPV
ncbi:MAG: hypothetical protein R2751_14535 [Bacteroidales bacterium]